MKILELFAGTRSIGKEFEKNGHQVFSIDWNKEFKNIDWYADIGQITAEEILAKFGRPDVIWASPDCTSYSVAAISHHRRKNTLTGNLDPISDYAKQCDTINNHVIDLIQALTPKFYFIENPRGGMRKMEWMQGIPRYTVTYCQYGDTRQKPTDIWTNHPDPQFKPPCKPGARCHESAPRGSKTGTQGLKGSRERSVIPEELARHIVHICEEHIKETANMQKKYTMGSLFDGSGGFPLAATLVGITPVWASEIEPHPIRVTRKRFPNMKHYGDITQMDGAKLEPVDLVTGGSPCQDMSVAGKRQGMSKQCPKCGYKTIGNTEQDVCPECGTELEYTRSGLFMEQIRVIKEMRAEDERRIQDRTADEHIRPRYMLWENVVGAFTSNQGEDFRAVLEETARVKDPKVTIPKPTNGKWNKEGCVMGDGWSIAWRTLDAQYWGVPQRRRRIALVADFGGQCAGEILFKRSGLSRNFAQSRKAWQGATGNTQESTRETVTDSVNNEQYMFNNCRQSMNYSGPLEMSPTIMAAMGMGGNNTPFVVEEKEPKELIYDIAHASRDVLHGISPTLMARMGTGGNQVPVVLQEPVAYEQRCYDIGDRRSVAHESINVAPTLTSKMGTGGNNVPVTLQEQKAYGIVSKGNGECFLTQEKHMSLSCGGGQAGQGYPAICEPVVYGISSYDSNAMKSSNPHSGIYEAETSRTLDLNGGNPACNQGGIAICEPAIAIQGSMIGRKEENGPQGDGINIDKCFTLNTIDKHAVCKKEPQTLCYREADLHNYKEDTNAGTLKASGGCTGGGSETLVQATYQNTSGTLMASGYNKLGTQEAMNDMFVANEYIVRKLTPLECSRLQGFPDWWSDSLTDDDPNGHEIAFWREVFETHRKVVTGASKGKTDKQIIKWLSTEPTDGAIYKMWGNGIALPCFLYVMEGIKEALDKAK